MNILEKIFAELNKENLDKSIANIQKHVQYVVTNGYKFEDKGISLIPVRDQLEYSDETLRKAGYILSISQLKQDAASYLEEAAKKPVIFNRYLKRIYRGIQTLEENYIQGNIQSEAVHQEIENELIRMLQDNYSNGSESKMPAELSKQISNHIDAQVTEMNAKWYERKLSPELSKAFTESFSNALLNDWHNGEKLGREITEMLEVEKNAINSTQALISCFQKKELPESIMKEVKEKLIGKITSEKSAGLISDFNEFAVAIKTKRNTLTNNDDFHICLSIITDWQNNQVHQDVKKALEGYLETIIGNMKGNFDSTLTQQFDQLATKAFLDKLQQGSLEKTALIEKFSHDVMKKLSSEINNESPFRKTIHATVSRQLRKEWIDGKLPEEANHYIQEHAFADLNDLAHEIENKAWKNPAKKESQELGKMIEQMRDQINRLSEELKTRGNPVQTAGKDNINSNSEKPSNRLFG